jgi:osmotically-inducible protein OsmY
VKLTTVLLLLTVGSASLLQGCAGAIVAGGATGASVIHDRRTAGTVLEDQNIEFKAMDALASDQELRAQAHISATSYNQVVLLSGEAPTQELRARAEALVAKIPKVRRVHNEVVIAAPSGMSARASDSWITTKVKTSLFEVKLKDFDPTRVKVVTENGIVFLMGLLTRQEADAVVDVVRQVSGVQRVVKIFEYIG